MNRFFDAVTSPLRGKKPVATEDFAQPQVLEYDEPAPVEVIAQPQVIEYVQPTPVVQTIVQPAAAAAPQGSYGQWPQAASYTPALPTNTFPILASPQRILEAPALLTNTLPILAAPQRILEAPALPTYTFQNPASPRRILEEFPRTNTWPVDPTSMLPKHLPAYTLPNPDSEACCSHCCPWMQCCPLICCPNQPEACCLPEGCCSRTWWPKNCWKGCCCPEHCCLGICFPKQCCAETRRAKQPAGKGQIATVKEKFISDQMDAKSMSLDVGHRVEVLSTNGQWVKVRDTGGKTGDVPRQILGNIDNMEGCCCAVM